MKAGINPNPPNPQSKPGQANPSPAKLIQIKMLGFTWFYSSESGLINGLQRFPSAVSRKNAMFFRNGDMKGKVTLPSVHLAEVAREGF